MGITYPEPLNEKPESGKPAAHIRETRSVNQWDCLGWLCWLGGLGTLEAQLPMFWVPVLKSLYEYILSITQGPTIWVPGRLGVDPEP